MRCRCLVAAIALATATGLLGACGNVAGAGAGSGSGEASAALPAPTPSPSLVAAARLDRCPSVAGNGPLHGADLPDAALPCLGSGPPVRLSALRGMPTVVNVWATWCDPCRAELPHFQWLHATAGARVRVLGVLFEDDPDGGLVFVRKLGVRFPSVFDVDGKLKQAGLVGLPATFFVRADGATSLKLGEVHSRAELRALVAERLGVTL
jgi:cytochrome c biogenesis protein CcmG/thiol:disulfide interchange protein DsbE